VCAAEFPHTLLIALGEYCPPRLAHGRYHGDRRAGRPRLATGTAGQVRSALTAHEQAVVAPDLRVHGLDGLRVVDASVMPLVVCVNTNAVTIMIAEKAVDLIRR
jgi:hypothetical protein